MRLASFRNLAAFSYAGTVFAQAGHAFSAYETACSTSFNTQFCISQRVSDNVIQNVDIPAHPLHRHESILLPYLDLRAGHSHLFSILLP